MKLEKDAVTICGFIGIFILLLLIIAPPVLRVLFNNETVDNSNKVLADVYEKLVCNRQDNFSNYNLNRTVTTIYKNNKITKINFVYIVNNKSNISNVYIDEYSILKQVYNAEVKEANNHYEVTLDYENNSYYDDEFLKKYSNGLSLQKEYYISNNYLCNMVK